MQHKPAERKRPAILDALAEWEAVSPQSVPTRDIKTLPELQPRNLALIKGEIDRLDHNTRLRDMVSSMKTPLKSLPTFDARDAVLVVATDNGLFMVDGHHRLKAYIKARRTTIPAKVLKKPMATAIAVSGMANTRGSTVALHKDEVTEAVWKAVSAILRQGRSTWEQAQAQGYSLRVIEEMFSFQVSHDTVRRMKDAVSWLKKQQIAPDDWPDWRAYCKLRRDGITDISEPDEGEEVETLARRFVALIGSQRDQIVIPAWIRALEIRAEAEKVVEQRLGPWESEEHLKNWDAQCENGGVY